MSRLLVYWNKGLVGTLTRHTKGRVQFRYSQGWLDKVGHSLSLSLPCREEKYSPGISTAFFENLLPEGKARFTLALNNRFDKKDTFAFLENFGEDCAGALSIIPEDEEPDFTPGQYEKIDSALIDALDKIQADPENYQLYSEMKNARLSIAGAQDKLPVSIIDEHFYLPLNSGSATTHIIKPASPYYPNIQRNEAFCMDLALSAGLRVPPSRLIQIGGHELFAIDRYDRQMADNNITRVHQEDFCQAMGIPADKKYQEKGGPGFFECRELVDEYLSDQGVEIRMNMVFIMAFNYLIGNRDAHGKNFSIIHDQKIEMAPFYDLVSTQVYPNLTNSFAMSIGKTFRYDRIKEHSLIAFAKDMKIRPRKLADLMDGMVQTVSGLYEAVLDRHEKEYGPATIYTNIFKVIKGNIEQSTRLTDILLGKQTESRDENHSDGPGM
jgi:serine/threonine-protein kinase HipA